MAVCSYLPSLTLLFPHCFMTLLCFSLYLHFHVLIIHWGNLTCCNSRGFSHTFIYFPLTKLDLWYQHKKDFSKSQKTAAATTQQIWFYASKARARKRNGSLAIKAKIYSETILDLFLGHSYLSIQIFNLGRDLCYLATRICPLGAVLINRLK